MSDAHTTETYKGWTIEIHQDSDSGESPREWSNLGFMACWHRRMWLGDEPKEIQRYNPIEYMKHILWNNYCKEIEKSTLFRAWKIANHEDMHKDDLHFDNYIEYMSDEDVHEHFNNFHVVLPIFAYEHGGITIRSGSFSDPWDSGQLGFIYVSKADALKEWKQKNWTKAFEKKIIGILDGEIETYDQYLTGDIHGYMIYRPEDEELGDSVDSCWGFYGRDTAMEEAESMVDWNIENDKKQEKLFNACLSL